MLDVKRLRLLWEFYARGTIAAVAAALSYSPSAVSQQLGILEREAGVPLFRRVGRTLELTAAGELLVAETEEILASLERAESSLRSARAEITGTVRVAVFQSAMLTLVPGTLRRLREHHPGLRVEVVQGEPGAALHETWARGFDLVIAEEYPGHSNEHFRGLERTALTRDPIQLAIPLVGAGDPRFDTVSGLGDLAGLPWVMEPRGTATRHWAEQTCRLAGFEPDVRFETADLQAHVRLIETGTAAALLPGLVGAAGRVRFVELGGDPCRLIFTAARAASSAGPAIAAVRDALAAEAGTLDFGGSTGSAPPDDVPSPTVTTK